MLSEIKSGYNITEQIHGRTIHNVISLGAALDRKEQEFLAKAGFNPNQPCVPAGSSYGGQWTDSGAGSGSGSGRVVLSRRELRDPGEPHPHEDSPYYDPVTGIYDPPINPTWSPLDFVGAAGPIQAAASLAKITVHEAMVATRVLRARIAGRRAAEESNAKLRKAADAIEDFLGGRPDPKDVKINPKGDIVIMKGNKKFRMDVKNPGYKRGPHGEKIPEEPHFRLQELKKNGKWGDATDGHRFYFKKEI